MEHGQSQGLGACRTCGHPELTEIPKPSSLLGVTSDDRLWKCSGAIQVCSRCQHVQKRNDEDWQQDASEVYAQYALYKSSAGAEHVVFGGSTPKPRSHLLLSHLKDQIQLPPNGRMLDVGCGNGPLLKSFGNLFPGWSMVGFEPSERYRTEVQDIPGVERFCSGTIDMIPGEFDLIALYYVLEHIPDPKQVLQDLRAKLKPGGLLVLIVPHYLENPFDLLVIDHCSHFTIDSLSTFMIDTGFEPLEVSTAWIPRAVAGVGRKTDMEIPPSNVQTRPEVATQVRSHLDWLDQVAHDATTRSIPGPFGIFGTATAGSWLSGILGDSVQFFLDEDPARTTPGNTHLGRPVHQPADAPAHEAIYIALPPELAQVIHARLELKFPHLKLVLPPRLAP